MPMSNGLMIPLTQPFCHRYVQQMLWTQ